jgi:hypothetical protein
MSVVISEALEQLFGLKERRAAIIEQFILAEAELQANMQQNAGKDFVDVHDLELSHKLLKPVLHLKIELETINAEFEEKKAFFVTLLESSGCHKLFCTNKQVNDNGQIEHLPYIISLSRNMVGHADLSIHPKTS